MNPFKEDQSLPQDIMIRFASQVEQVEAITNSEIEQSIVEGYKPFDKSRLTRKKYNL